MCWASTLPAQTPTPPVPEPVRTSITVTAHIQTETPANVQQLTADDLRETPGANLDDRLRQVPGFSLFRRASSLVANPTTQGVSLRGIGSTGASRTLVLFDGIPFNDPFGGWVYWTRFIPDDLERVEISRGASTSLFGDLALGGAINIFPREPTSRHSSFGYEAGTKNTHDLWAGYSEAFRNLAVTVSGRGFTSEGYFIVPASVRGAIDRKANVRFVNDGVRLDGFEGPHRLYAWINTLVEERNNGTLLTHNSTTVGTAALRYTYQAAHDAVSVSGFGTSGQFHASFSSITNNRNTETLTTLQTVPEEALGGSAIWNHSSSTFDVAIGADVNRPRGTSTDHIVSTRGTRIGGGSLLQHGEFFQGDAKFGPLQLYLGARHQFTGQGPQYFTPSGGIAVGHQHWRARGSIYRAFRSPTLNELFREFRAGNTITRANANLQPETLLGAEVGIDYLTERAAFRVTAFRNDLHALITNVTLSSTAAQIIRQRQNAGDALSKGFEISARQGWRDWTGEASYLYADSRYNTGLRIPQVPKHQGSAQVSYSRNRTLASAGLRTYAYQFDDDQNRFLLPGFAVVEFLVRQRLWRDLSASFQLTNALDHEFLTGNTPTPTIGEPRLLRAGLVWRR